MAPEKRKAPLGDLSADRTRRKIAKGDKNDAPGEGDAPPPAESSRSENSTKGAKGNETKTIQWILPKNATKNTKEAFAPILLQQPLQKLENRRRAVFDRPQLPSPIHTEEQGDISEAQKDQRLDKFRITNKLREFHDLVWNKNNDYIRDVGDENVSLIGLPGDDRVLLLAGDDEGTLNVTVQPHTNEGGEHAAEPEEATESASIRIIRRTIPGEVSELFLVLPPNGTVWVNNKDFFNAATKNDSSDQYIGPLGEFSIIELLSTPIFLWRNRTDTLFNETAVIPSKRPKTLNPLPSSMSAKVTFNRPGSEDNLPTAGGTESRVGRENEHGQERSEQGALAALEDIINPVILAVSSLQEGQNEGFSVDIDGILIRPGRPWIFPLRIFCATVLVVMQFVESDNGRRITIHILDPIQHNPNQNARKDIWHAVTGSDILQRWLTGLGLDLEEIKVVLPENAYWVDSPGGLDDHEAYTITALNAWVLAMGLNLNPDWIPPNTSSEGTGTPNREILYSRNDFFQEASRLISLARSGRNLDWEILYQFFRVQNYVIDDGPPQENRRFNLETVSTPDFKESQLNAQNQEAAQLKAYRLAEDGMTQIRAARESMFARTNKLRVNFLGSNRTHSETFPSKKAAEKFDPCWHLQTRLEQLGQSYQSEAPLDHTDIGYKRVVSSVSAVTQAVAHTTGYAADFECIDCADSNNQQKLPYSGRRLLLLPYCLDCLYFESSNTYKVFRNVLAVIQPLPNGSGRTFSVHVFDHAPWLSDQEMRRTAYKSIQEHLKYLTGFENVEIKGEDISWVVDPPPCGLELWQLSYYTILNAWSICLGLHINQDFRAGEGFFQQAALVARLARDGLADWKLIWSFLRCKKFVIDEEVPRSRQFTQTVAERQLHENLNELRQKVSLLPPNKDTVIYKLPDTQSRFPTDTWKYSDYDALTQDIAPLLRAGRSVAGLEAGELLEKSRKEGKRQDESRAHKERPKNPCKAFNEEFQPLCKTHIQDINRLKSNLNNKRQATETFLECIHVNQIIGSVVLAINKNENIYTAVCWPDPDLVNLVCQANIEVLSDLTLDRVLEFLPLLRSQRFSRPMIFGIVHASHIVLMVIQHDEKQNISPTVLDSSPTYYNKSGRNVIHHIGSQVLKFSQWRDPSVESPDHTTWESCAVQSTHYTCGYHAIYNGWAAAFGLRLNPRFRVEWKPYFLDQAQNLICLAMLGQASSEMIHNYLECINFILPNQVVEMSLRFHHTVNTNVPRLSSTRNEMLEIEEGIWISFTEGEERDQAIKKISQENRVHFPSGNSRRHDADWDSDPWPQSGDGKDKTANSSFTSVVENSAAIVQAIDEKQQKQAGGLFTSGLTLATRLALQKALEGELGIATRPRRCWFMPYQFAKNEAKNKTPEDVHYLLAVLQEEKADTGAGSEFRVYFLDSDPGITKAARLQIFENVKRIAHNMQWTKHRNVDAHVQFCTKPRYVRVAKQERDDMSGFHTILNVWILSIGMTPKIKPKIGWEQIYQELDEMIERAGEGGLHWISLVVWLFKRDLTVENIIGPVAQERVFNVSTSQKANVRLRTYINQSHLHDNYLGIHTEADAPYVHNNVDFSKETWQFEDGEQQENVSEPRELHRNLEDIDLLDLTGNENDWPSFFTELTQTAYHDLRYG